MKQVYVLLASAAAVASAACNAENGSSANAGPSEPVKAVAPPQGGDWSKLVSKTPQGGFVMGNPNAAVKLVEIGSMTCPHCAKFEMTGTEKLINDYVKSGRINFEFRNFVRDPFDLTASLIARCGGPERFFPLTHALFASQGEWTGKLQNVPQSQLQALSSLSPDRQFVEIAKLTGFQQWAAQRGVPSARSSACLKNQSEINQLVQMNSDVTTQFPDFKGTPSFLINGKMVENAGTWEALQPKLREALGERS